MSLPLQADLARIRQKNFRTDLRSIDREHIDFERIGKARQRFVAVGIVQQLAIFPGNRARADQRAEDAGGVGRIALSAVAAARGVVHGFVPIAVVIEQADDDVSAIQFRVDIKRLLVAVGAVFDLAPFRLQQMPGLQPVVGIFIVPLNHVVDKLRL